MLKLDPIFEEYVTELRDVRYRDQKTVSRNEYALARLTTWLDEQALEASAVDGRTLKRYFGSLRGSLAETTLDTEVAIVKAAYRFAHDELEALSKYPAFSFEIENGDDEEPKTFTNDELRTIRSFIMDDLEELIFYLLTYTGMRRCELCALKWADMDFETRELKVIGKRKKLRRIPIHPVLMKLLRKRHRGQPKDAFVLGKGGSLRNVNHRLSALLRRAGVDGGNRPAHAFRKTVASVLAEEGVNPTDIDKIMGWSPPTVRERYYTRTSPKLYDAICCLYRSDPIEQQPGTALAVVA
jgi:integrase